VDIDEYKKKIELAKKASEGFEEPYKSISFEVILKNLLNEERWDNSSPKNKVEKTLIDFIEEKKAINHTEKILCMAYYLYKFKRVDLFTSDDIKKSYFEARRKEPANISDFLNKLHKKNFLMKRGQKDGLKAYSLTLEGIKHVEELGDEKS